MAYRKRREKIVAFSERREPGTHLRSDHVISACQIILSFWKDNRHDYRWIVQYRLSGWPSGLRRQTQGINLQNKSVLVHECGRGFESHF